MAMLVVTVVVMACVIAVLVYVAVVVVAVVVMAYLIAALVYMAVVVVAVVVVVACVIASHDGTSEGQQTDH